MNLPQTPPNPLFMSSLARIERHVLSKTEYVMSKSGLFVFFLGLGMSAVSLLTIGLDPAAVLRAIVMLCGFTLALYVLAVILSGHFEDQPEDEAFGGS